MGSAVPATTVIRGGVRKGAAAVAVALAESHSSGRSSVARIHVRLAAFLLDAAITSVPLGALALALPIEPVIVVASTNAVHLLYFVFFWSGLGHGTTPGMRAFRVRVVRTDDSTLSVARALLRYLALLLSFTPLGLGVVWVLIDGRRQGWHDKVAGTLVVEN